MARFSFSSSRPGPAPMAIHCASMAPRPGTTPRRVAHKSQRVQVAMAVFNAGQSIIAMASSETGAGLAGAGASSNQAIESSAGSDAADASDDEGGVGGVFAVACRAGAGAGNGADTPAAAGIAAECAGAG